MITLSIYATGVLFVYPVVLIFRKVCFQGVAEDEVALRIPLVSSTKKKSLERNEQSAKSR